MGNIFIKTYGCSFNRSISQELSVDLEKAGFRVWTQGFGSDKEYFRDEQEKHFALNCDAIIINTCTLTEYAEKELMIGFRNFVRKNNEKAKIIFVGCSVRNKNSLIRKLKNRDLVTNDKKEILNYLKDIKDIGSHLSETHQNRSSVIFPVLIKKGCTHYCSFCICPFIHKSTRCLSKKEIMKKLKIAKSAGYNSIEFGGSCIGDWIDPENSNLNFANLIKLILKETSFSIANLELHPKDISDDLIEILSERRIRRDISIPIQSGSDTLLKKMNRGYNTNFLRKLFQKLYQKIPDLRVSTDVIIGFPGETEKDFKDTCNFLKEIKFNRIDVYKYSLRIGTPAAAMKQIPEIITQKRISKISKILSPKNLNITTP